LEQVELGKAEKAPDAFFHVVKGAQQSDKGGISEGFNLPTKPFYLLAVGMACAHDVC
jgi:hypothetical protein